jgi:very-short-patch-repair endonuclease
MGRRARIPAALARGVFTLADAQRNGVNRWNLEGARWRRLGPATYVARDVADTPLLRIEAANRRLPEEAAFSGFTAAWLHGLDLPCEPIEITVPSGSSISTRAGMKVRRCSLAKGEVVKVQGFRATSVVRTVRDLCARLSLTEAVVVIDMALHAALVRIAALQAAVDASAGLQGVWMLRRALEHVEQASESPMETRLRMLLVLAGIRRPEAQVTIRDRWHRFLGRLDLYYRDERLGLEYDGGTHRDSLAEDNRRQNRLVDAGVRLLRFTAGDIYNTPDLVINSVRSALAA